MINNKPQDTTTDNNIKIINFIIRIRLNNYLYLIEKYNLTLLIRILYNISYKYYRNHFVSKYLSNLNKRVIIIIFDLYYCLKYYQLI